MNRVGRIIAIVLIVTCVCSLFLGCASTRRGQEQTKGAAVGAGVGAVIGGVLGYLVAGERGALIGASVGAAAGATAGYTYASRVYDNIEKSSNKVDTIEQASVQNQSYIDEQTKELEELVKRKDELDKQTAALANDYRDRKITAETLAANKAKYDKELADARIGLEAHQKELAYLKDSALPVTQKYGKQEQILKLENQISTVEKQNQEMERAIEESASCCQRLVSG